MSIDFHNRPPHVYLNDSYYFIVARTLNAQHFLNSGNKKRIWLKCLSTSLSRFNFTCQSWVILNNHYQLVIKTKLGKNLPFFISRINSGSARLLNKSEKKEGRKIWWNYWDTCLQSKKSFWTHVNYNHYNPVKHGYARRAEDYPFSSLRQYLKQFGPDFINELRQRYPVTDFSPSYEVED